MANYYTIKDSTSTLSDYSSLGSSLVSYGNSILDIDNSYRTMIKGLWLSSGKRYRIPPVYTNGETLNGLMISVSSIASNPTGKLRLDVLDGSTTLTTEYYDISSFTKTSNLNISNNTSVLPYQQFLEFSNPIESLSAKQFSVYFTLSVSNSDEISLFTGSSAVVDTANNQTLSLYGSYKTNGGITNENPFSSSGYFGSFAYDGTTTNYFQTNTNIISISGDLTLDLWVLPKNTTTTKHEIIFDSRGAVVAADLVLGFNPSQLVADYNKIGLYLGGTWKTTTLSNLITANAWNHIAVTRSVSTYKVYVNGISALSAASNAVLNASNYASNILIGRPFDNGYALSGNMTYVRLISGASLYTGATIQVPTMPPTLYANTSAFNNFERFITADVLLVGGGAAGGGWTSGNGGGGGGGGAGGVVYKRNIILDTYDSNGYNLIVGAGGARTTTGQGAAGGNTSMTTATNLLFPLNKVVAYGGGGGGSINNVDSSIFNGLNGACGGGGMDMNGNAVTHLIPGGNGYQGYHGGGASGTRFYSGNTGSISKGGGGGGAGGVGGDATQGISNGDGGVGIICNITGTDIYYGGGGGGAGDTTQFAGGAGGGGNGGWLGAGGTTATVGTSGTNGLGGGGGAGTPWRGDPNSANHAGLAGGCGAIIIRYDGPPRFSVGTTNTFYVGNVLTTTHTVTASTTLKPVLQNHKTIALFEPNPLQNTSTVVTNNYEFRKYFNFGDTNTTIYTLSSPSTYITNSLLFTRSTNIGVWTAAVIPQMNAGVGDFTVESWVYLRTRPTSDLYDTNTFFVFNFFNNSGIYNFGCCIGNTKMFLRAPNAAYNTSLKYGDFTHNIALSTWYHVTWMRANSSLYCFVNGSSLGSSVSLTGNFTSQDGFSIGGGYSQVFDGYITNVRYTKNAIYDTAGFTVPSAPLPVLPKTALLYKAPFKNYYLCDPELYDIDKSYNITGSTKNNVVNTKTFTLDRNLSAKNINIYKNGILNFSTISSASLALSGGIKIYDGGSLSAGTSSDPISSSLTHTIYLSNCDIDVLDGGTLNLFGANKLPSTYLTYTTSTNNSSFTVTDDISSSWKVSDTIILTPNISSNTTYDKLSISGFTDSNKFVTKSNSTYIHNGISALSQVPSIYNLNRNIRIYKYNSNSYDNQIRFSGNTNVNVSNVELSGAFDGSNAYPILINDNKTGSIILSSNVFSNQNKSIFNVNDSFNFSNNIIIKNNIIAYTSNSKSNSYPDTTWGVYFKGGLTDYTASLYLEGGETMNLVGVSAWTIEFFIKPETDRRAVNKTAFILHKYSSWVIGYRTGRSAPDNTVIFYDTANSLSYRSNASLNMNSWNHVAITFNSAISSLRMYINGSYDAAWTIATACHNNDANYPVWLGTGALLATGDATWTVTRGTLSNLRYTKNQNVYSDASFTPPTPNLTPIGFCDYDQGIDPDNVLILALQQFTPQNNCNYGYTFAVGVPKTNEWYGNQTIEVEIPTKDIATDLQYNKYKFSPIEHGQKSYAVELGGTDALIVDMDQLDIGTNNFTIEFWAKPKFQYNNTVEFLLTVGREVSDGFITLYMANNGIRMFTPQTASPFYQYQEGNCNGTNYVCLTSGIWQHLAIVRNGLNTTFYLNGSPAISAVKTTTPYNLNLGNKYISLGLRTTDYWGTNATTFNTRQMFNNTAYKNYFNYKGLISNFRFTLSSALYTSSFTPPTSALLGGDLNLCSSEKLIDKSYNKIPVTTVNYPKVVPYGPNLKTYINNLNISDNVILSSSDTDGLNVSNIYGTNATISGNTIIGSQKYGLNISDSTISSNSVLGSTVYNSTSAGLLLSGVKTEGIINGKFLYNKQQGILIDGNTTSLSSSILKDVLLYRNEKEGLKIIGDTSSKTNKLNVIGLSSIENYGIGFDAYNITGTLSNIYLKDNSKIGMKLNIGNDDTIISNISSIYNETNGTSGYFYFPGALNASKPPIAYSSNNPFNTATDGSWYLSGNSDLFLSTQYNSTPIDKDCVYEFWYKPTGSQTAFQKIMDTRLFNAGLPFVLYYNITISSILCAGSISMYTGGTAGVAGNTAYHVAPLSVIKHNDWNHIAVVKKWNGSLFNKNACYNIYVNGVSSLYVDPRFTALNHTSDNGVIIGRELFTNSNVVTGYFSNIRFSINDRGYNGSTISVPTSSFTVDDDTILLYKDASFGNAYQTSNIKYISQHYSRVSNDHPFEQNTNDGSLVLTAKPDYEFIRSADLMYVKDKTTEYTVECWFKPIQRASANDKKSYVTTNWNSQCIIDTRSMLQYRYIGTNNNGTLISMNENQDMSTYMVPRFWVDGTSYMGTTKNKIKFNNWNHALVTNLSNGTFRAYLNGTLSVTGTRSDTNFRIAMNIGTYFEQTLYKFSGKISNVRLLNKALYSSNQYISAIPVPSAPFDVDENTLFLLNEKYDGTYKTASNTHIQFYGKNTKQTYLNNIYLTGGSPLVLNSTNFDEFVTYNMKSVSAYTSTPTINIISLSSTPVKGSYIFDSCTTSVNQISGLSNYSGNGFNSKGIVFLNNNGANGASVAYFNNGSRMLDNDIYNSNPPSERLTPTSSFNRIKSGSKYMNLNSGDFATINVLIRPSSVTSDGVAYKGSNPRLMLKSNSSMGVYYDTTLAELDAKELANFGRFNVLRGVTPIAPVDGVYEIYIDCSGTEGWVNIDDWNVS